MELNVAAACEAIASAHPDRDCVVAEGRVWSWSEVQERTRRLAAVLAGAGLGHHSELRDGDPAHGGRGSAQRWTSSQDHVALYLHNGNEYLEGMLGAWKARCAPFNVNYRYVADELRYLLDDSGARAIIVADTFAPVLEQVLPTLRHRPTLVLQVRDGSGHELIEGAIEYEAALAAAVPVLDPNLVASWSGDDLYLCYTGGTTGMPKGTMWRQADFVVAALGVRRRDGTDHESLDELVDAAKGSVRALPAPPLMHGAAHWNALSCWLAGGTVIIQDVVDRFDPRDVLDTVEAQRATSLLVVGDPMARPLVDQLRAELAEGRHRDLSSLRHLLSGGAVLSPTCKAQLLELIEGLAIVDVLGSTESGRQGVAQVRSGEDTSGGFSPSATAVVLSEDLSRRLRPGDDELGWLAQRGRVPLGYLGDPEKTRATFPVVDGERYAVAGDRARWRNDGTIELHGRDSVCINTGGEKVFAEEVETALKIHPGVLDAVVCGRPSERWGEEVVAVVAMRPDATASDEELRETAGEHLARYKLPRAIVRVPEVLRAPSGKADYRWARTQATT
ncbi:MAG: AMP-binding protein [Microthrixaceae bacterium]